MNLMTDFRNAMAQLGSAITIITTDGPGGKYGFTASAVCSVTDEPPTLLICMNRSSFANSKFKENGVLCVNILSAQHRELSGVFANGKLRSDERFLHDNWQTLTTGAPVLTSAIASFDCTIGDCHEVGSHSIFYCPVQDIGFGQGEQGLVYFNRQYHTLAASL
ncbi:TPA: flavin reductase [Klebsiella pneumoniae]|uniref:flavin reductase n=1 Tax=Enterobacteriaceae TaxID=543 RepID=UPI0004D5B08A|nr:MULTISPECIES: flavin reductase [Enterobacteriaceae]EJO3119354.1 flavin reductase [Klebsiella pneumoniae]EKU6355668.1 flavin reductase [Klebsiella quasipneumoniae]KEA50717.1 flavin reductase [Mangrovibacter sp. MFB070]MBP0691026.1 flavin reductase [Klebsiella pneumoniae]MBY7098795.1 flavin reductase [Klebsiella quasipneumoniae]